MSGQVHGAGEAMCWAYEQQDLAPLDKFVLVTWAEWLFSPDVDLTRLAWSTCIPAGQLPDIIDRLIADGRMPQDWPTAWVLESVPVNSGRGKVNRRIIYPLLVKRDGEYCQACRAIADLQIDHVMPQALGGTHDLTNLQLLCAACNRRKKDRHPDDWQRLLAGKGIGVLVPG